jgi:hypothetical protein
VGAVTRDSESVLFTLVKHYTSRVTQYLSAIRVNILSVKVYVHTHTRIASLSKIISRDRHHPWE